MKILTGRVAHIIFVLPMVAFGFGHFMNAKAMAGMVPLPGGEFWVYLTGVALIAGAVGVILNIKAKLAAFLLGVMIFIFAFALHLKGMLSAETQAVKMMEMMQFMKDIAIAAGAWAIAGKLEN